MTASLAHIWRHPIKGIGCEAMSATSLSTGRPLPGDRAWAVLRAGETETGGWQPCTSFLRGANGPQLMAIEATTTVDRIDLRHPIKGVMSFDPETQPERLIEWLDGLWPTDYPAPVKLVKAPPEGMSDVDYPSVSILSLTSLQELGARAGQALDMRRFRGNLWVEGLETPFEEFDWLGRQLAIGSAILEVVERNGRCRATHANPETGERDLDILGVLKAAWGHTDFGVYARVLQGGEISVGDQIALLG